ncbi:AP-3 complex subunit beta-2 [Pelomyxa schiedti]|nr:AP-3 complex subunit beta-2 [Pelomyxa schiedti]
MQAMETVAQMMLKGKNVSSIMTDVIANAECHNVQLRRLVYMYLVTNARRNPSSVAATLHTSVVDCGNPLSQMYALRAISNLPFSETSLVVNKVVCWAAESQPRLRKTASHAVPKLLRISADLKSDCVHIVSVLLRDKNPSVLGSAVQAFLEVCPDNMELIHPIFSKLCNMLPNMDEWGQISLITLLQSYGRSNFTSPHNPDIHTCNDLDVDYQLLIKSSKPLLHSQSPAVVLSVAILFYHLAPCSELPVICKPLLRLIRGNREASYVALSNIASMAESHPEIFVNEISSFFVYPRDLPFIQKLKLSIIPSLISTDNSTLVLAELSQYIKSYDIGLVCATISAINKCLLRVPDVLEVCVNLILPLLSHPDTMVVSASVLALKALLQRSVAGPVTNQLQGDLHGTCVRKLATILQDQKLPSARATIIWVLGEYSDAIVESGADILNSLEEGFSSEDCTVRLQIMKFGAKLYAKNQEVGQVLQRILEKAKVDTNVDIRDFSRITFALLFGKDLRSSQLGKHINSILHPLGTHNTLERKMNENTFDLGTLSHLLNTEVTGYRPLPDFPQVATDPTLRITVDETDWEIGDDVSDDELNGATKPKPTLESPSCSDTEEAEPVIPRQSDIFFGETKVVTSVETGQALLSAEVSGGLSVEYLCSPKLPQLGGRYSLPVRLLMRNDSEKPIVGIKVGTLAQKELPFCAFEPLTILSSHSCAESLIYAQFPCPLSPADTQWSPIKFELSASLGTFWVTVQPSLNDLLLPPVTPIAWSDVQNLTPTMHKVEMVLIIRSSGDSRSKSQNILKQVGFHEVSYVPGSHVAMFGILACTQAPSGTAPQKSPPVTPLVIVQVDLSRTPAILSVFSYDLPTAALILKLVLPSVQKQA